MRQSTPRQEPVSLGVLRRSGAAGLVEINVQICWKLRKSSEVELRRAHYTRGMLLGLFLLMTGCMGIVSRVDPSFPRVTYAALSAAAKNDVAVGVIVEFHRSGVAVPEVTSQTREAVLEILRKTQLFALVSSGVANTNAQIEVMIDNTKGETHGSGYVTGATLGAIGTDTVDPYTFVATYRTPGSDPITRQYEHRLYSKIGGARAANNSSEWTSIRQAYDKIVEELILRFLKDLQTQGVL